MDWYMPTRFPITGVVPLVYLVLLYYRAKIKYFLGPMLKVFQPCIIKLLHLLRCHSWILQAVIVCAYYPSAVFLSKRLPLVSLFVIGTPLGLFTLNRLIDSFTNDKFEDSIFWLTFAVFYLFSLVEGYSNPPWMLALGSTTMFFIFWIYNDHWRWIDGQFDRLFRASPRDRNGIAV